MTQPGLPSRSQAIRELVIQALDAADAKADKKPKP
jgi:metal-responsive CopG/Arc/MetJ family transcriptional regulator